jgi:hypothetical protein
MESKVYLLVVLCKIFSNLTICHTRLEDSSLGITILSLIIFVTRVALVCFQLGSVKLDTLYNILLSGLWTYLLHAQSSGDLTDVDHPSPRPWYNERGCSDVEGHDRKICVLAKVLFAYTMIFWCVTINAVLERAPWILIYI